jgi:uncharacterized protein (DUF1697 family)
MARRHRHRRSVASPARVRQIARDVPTYVALLRGINVGGKNKLPMADLRSLVESLGHTDVTTYIQSGNVVFTSSKPVAAKALETAIKDRFGIGLTVVLRTPAELAKVVKANPFAPGDLSKVHVGFMAEKPSKALIAKLDATRFEPDAVVVHGAELYFHLPDGMGHSKLPDYVGRALKIPTTVRNWNTVLKLASLAGA